MREPCSGVRTQANASLWGDAMQIEYRETLLHAGAAMRAWCHYLRSAGKWRRLTSTEEMILHNAEFVAGDIKRVLCGQHPEDQELRTVITIERSRCVSEPVLDPEGCQLTDSHQ